MPRSIAEVIDALDRIAPFGTAADWDPVGLQLGNPNREPRSVVVCHEITEIVLEKILAIGPGLVVTYHPLIFRPLESLTAGPNAAGRALRLAEAGVAVLTMHTNFDAAEGGTADSLASSLGLVDLSAFGTIEVAHPHQRSEFDISGAAGNEAKIGRVGSVSTLSLRALANVVERVLGSRARLAGDLCGPIARVAVVPGSGADFIDDAVSSGADVLVTGDVSHHRAREANELGMAVIDPGHAPTERPGVKALYSFVESVVGGAVDLTGIDDSPWETG